MPHVAPHFRGITMTVNLWLQEAMTADATLDNLLKGAATQALQNLNLALGFDELAGIAA